MDAADFRTLALAMPLVVEGSHMDHPDFRIGGRRGKVFASLPPRRAGDDAAALGMVKLTPPQQAELVRQRPGVFTPAAGAWGVSGYTYVVLDKAARAAVKKAVEMAWHNVAPVKLIEELGREMTPPRERGPTKRRRPTGAGG